MKELDQDWQALSEQILTDSKEWRRSHPKATLREIEEVHARMSRWEAQVIQDAAGQSERRDWSRAERQERPICPVCGTPLQARGKRSRRGPRRWRATDPSHQKLWLLSQLRDRTFSPSMRNEHCRQAAA